MIDVEPTRERLPTDYGARLLVTDIDAWFAELDRFADVPFMEEGRQQPPIPAADDLFG